MPLEQADLWQDPPQLQSLQLPSQAAAAGHMLQQLKQVEKRLSFGRMDYFLVLRWWNAYSVCHADVGAATRKAVQYEMHRSRSARAASER
jgi:hypothetical protein